MKRSGLQSWRRVIDAQVRERRLALARAQRQLARCAAVEETLLAERTRRDAAERERRAQGQLPGFAEERMNALLEQAIARAAANRAAARAADERALAALREVRQRQGGIDRLLERRARRDRQDAARAEQSEIDEIAGRRRAGPPAETRR